MPYQIRYGDEHSHPEGFVLHQWYLTHAMQYMGEIIREGSWAYLEPVDAGDPEPFVILTKGGREVMRFDTLENLKDHLRGFGDTFDWDWNPRYYA